MCVIVYQETIDIDYLLSDSLCFSGSGVILMFDVIVLRSVVWSAAHFSGLFFFYWGSPNIVFRVLNLITTFE